MPLVNGLPAFVKFASPREALRIIDTGDAFKVEGRAETFALVSEAYDYIYDKLGLEAIFDEATLKRVAGDDQSTAGGIYMEPGTNRLLASYDANLHEDIVRDGYKEFLDAWRVYAKHPENFYVSYNYLNRHPAFWQGYKMKDDISWECDYGMGEAMISVYMEEGLVRVLLEHGPYVDDLHKTHTIDPRIVSVDDSYEAAVILMAKRVNDFYDETGSEINRPAV
jgi:hypothetical protein